MRRHHSWFMALAMALAAMPVAVADDAPQRVVSINLCTDQLLMLLARREHIAAVSYLAAIPDLSALAPLAQNLPSVRNSAEEVLALKPDLVLAGAFTTRHTTRMLRSFGIKVLTVPAAEDFDALRKQLRDVGAALHESRRAEEIIGVVDSRLAALQSAPWRRAGFYRQGGHTVGKGTMSDAIMSAARVHNVAASAGLKGYGYLPLERFIFERPEWFIGSDYKRGVPTVGAQVLRHPVLRLLPGDEFVMPGRFTACSGLWSVEAAELLSRHGVTR